MYMLQWIMRGIKHYGFNVCIYVSFEFESEIIYIVHQPEHKNS